MNCPNCGANIADDLKYCNVCGKTIHLDHSQDAILYKKFFLNVSMKKGDRLFGYVNTIFLLLFAIGLIVSSILLGYSILIFLAVINSLVPLALAISNIFDRFSGYYYFTETEIILKVVCQDEIRYKFSDINALMPKHNRDYRKGSVSSRGMKVLAAMDKDEHILFFIRRNAETVEHFLKIGIIPSYDFNK